MGQQHNTRVREAEKAGRLYAADHDWRPCLRGIQAIHGYAFDEATAFASAHHRAVLNRGGRPETRCSCADLSFPFCS
jgi:hypothetical protein